MTSRRMYVKIHPTLGQRVRGILLDAGILDTDFKIVKEDGYLYLPTKTNTDESVIISLLATLEFETGFMEFQLVIEGPRTLEETLESVLTPTQIELLPRAYDFIGDIAVLEIPLELEEFATQIGTAFHSIHKNFSTVLAKKGAISGVTRTREYVLLSGEYRTKTIHIEYGIRMAVDLSVAYFSPRLLEEHNRVATLVREGESVIDMFTGVGPFALHITKQTQASVLAIDINEAAINLLKESITLNRLTGTINPIVGDAHEVVQKRVNEKVDRVIMNHPSGAEKFVLDACQVLRSGGMMHFYGFGGSEDPEGQFKERVTSLVEEAERVVSKIPIVRRVRDSAPREYQMVADVILR